MPETGVVLFFNPALRQSQRRREMITRNLGKLGMKEEQQKWQISRYI